MRTQDPPPLSGSPVLEKQGRLGTLNSPCQDLAEPPPCQDLEAPPPPPLAPALPPLHHSGGRSPAARRRIRPSSHRRTPLLPLPRACSISMPPPRRKRHPGTPPPSPGPGRRADRSSSHP